MRNYILQSEEISCCESTKMEKQFNGWNTEDDLNEEVWSCYIVDEKNCSYHCAELNFFQIELPLFFCTVCTDGIVVDCTYTSITKVFNDDVNFLGA